MKQIIFFIFYFLPLVSFTLEVSPWFGEVYEFYFLSKYAYSRYNKVNGAKPPLKSTSNDNLFYFDLSCSPSNRWNLDTDFELVKTPRQSFGFRSVAFQARYLLLDDVVGDALTIATGLNTRIISKDSLKDVSCPYHGEADFEGNLGMGKEFAQSESWHMRLWLYGALGQANRGSPWLKGTAAIEGNLQDTRRWAIFTDVSHGYGKKESININNFNGYGDIRYKYIDIGIRLGYRFEALGSLSFEYKRRVLSKLCPSEVNTFSVSYLLPFSF
jgi:hypothetical protein